MIYLSAQPDQSYFIWQLEIQLRNFHSLHIERAHIHVLVAFDPVAGLKPSFRKFIEDHHHLALFFCYPDKRIQTKYTSSIRPNIIKQHYEAFRDLKNEVIFYHDSDILLSRVPIIPDLYGHNICYVSDTRNYLGAAYIKRAGSKELLVDMANVVGLDVDLVEKNEEHSGGAQYILKNLEASFWDKVERDAETLFVLMRDFNINKWEKEYPEKKEYRGKNKGIQSWCADMWSVLWNLWFIGTEVKIHPEMDFSWPQSPIALWDELAILHYSGDQKNKDIFFKKTEYTNHPPWYDDRLQRIPVSNCSYRIVQAISARKKELDAERIDLKGTCFILKIDRINEEQLLLLSIAKRYLLKYFNCSVLTYSASENEADNKELPVEEELLVKDDWIRKLKTRGGDIENYICYSSSTLISTADILRIIEESKLLFEKIHILKPRVIHSVDLMFTEAFSKTLDIELLKVNSGKFHKKECFSDQIIWFTPSFLQDFKPEMSLSAASPADLSNHCPSNRGTEAFEMFRMS